MLSESSFILSLINMQATTRFIFDDTFSELKACNDAVMRITFMKKQFSLKKECISLASSTLKLPYDDLPEKTIDRGLHLKLKHNSITSKRIATQSNYFVRKRKMLENSFTSNCAQIQLFNCLRISSITADAKKKAISRNCASSSKWSRYLGSEASKPRLSKEFLRKTLEASKEKFRTANNSPMRSRKKQECIAIPTLASTRNLFLELKARNRSFIKMGKKKKVRYKMKNIHLLPNFNLKA
eukprot:TRINITY_DN4934_c0_g1_i3.p1 TRINITY_DN4934_c0_g1~~TRINITY_DN4934_c0_g1_i3.p1  ORF type:complete len:240 (-),score=22.42 TRINITY_DN4934_c0_g1_i3:276-995(-)